MGLAVGARPGSALPPCLPAQEPRGPISRALAHTTLPTLPLLTLLPLLALLAILVPGCGDDGVPGDGGIDGDAGTADGGEASPAATAALPVLTPCPEGWAESTLRGEVTVCLPFGEAGAADCPAGQMQVPGAAGCEDIGTACPADGAWAADLPTDRTVVYVRAGATGGTGTTASPFGTIAEGLSAAGGGVVALTAGRYDEAIFVDDGTTLWGACTEGTVLTNTSPLAVPILLIRGTGGGIRNMTIGEDPRLGVHITGGTAELHGVEIRNAVGFGLLVSGGELHGERVVVRDILSDPMTGLGRGVQVEYGATATIDGLVVERVIATGIWVGNDDTRATRAAVSVRDVYPYQRTGRAGRFGRGLEVIEGAEVSLESAFIGNVHEVGVGVDGTAAVLRVRDVRIEDVKSRMNDQLGGRSTSSQLGGRLELERVSIARSRVSGASLHGPNAEAIFTDVVIDGVAGADRDGSSSRAIEAFEASQLTGSRIAILDGGGFGLLIGDEGSRATVQDFRVLGLAGVGANGTHGHGVHSQNGAVVAFERLQVESVRGFGAIATSGASLSVTDLRVDQIEPWACADETCPEGQSFAHGVGVYTGASLAFSRFDLSNAAFCGIYVGEGAGADTSFGAVSTCEIGACIGDPEFDVARISEEVRYRDNGVNLDSRSLPVPGPGEDLGSI